MRTLKEWYRYLRGDADIASLRKRGMRIGSGCSIQPHCLIDPQHCWLISIGNNVTLAPRVHILAHDASTKRSLGYTKIGLVDIGDDVFIGAGSVVMPGVTIGDGAVIGAASVVAKDVPSGMVAAGNPAHIIKSKADYLDSMQKQMDHARLFGNEYTITGGITDVQKNEMIACLREAGGHGFVR